MRAWTEAHPGRLQAEAEAFARRDGLEFELDDAELTASGRVVFRGTLTLPGRDDPIALEVRYPESFPYLRPEVFAPELRLGRHQNPYRHNLCLLEASTRHWNPSNTGAWLVGERVPELLSLLEGDPDELRRREAPQGEPASAYFQPLDGSVVFIPDTMLSLPKEHRGGVARLSTGLGEPRRGLLRACLTRVETQDRKGRPLLHATADAALTRRFGTTAYEARWVRLDGLPATGRGDADELWEAARQTPAFQQPPEARVDGARVRILAVVCEEEVRQGEYADAWLFAVQLTQTDGERRKFHYVARGQRLSPRDLAERIPTLAGLPGKTVALAGLGALGGPVAGELARAQLGELRVLDQDHVEAGTIVRWPHGTSAVGHPKVNVLGDHLPVDYPFTTVRRFHHRIGRVAAPGEPSGPSELDVLSEFLADADLLVDATAEIGVQQLLASLADQAGIPQVYVSATEGGWGGVVARVVPGRTGCWLCLQHHLTDRGIAPPPAASTGTVQPRGCVAPTWTGSSFDALPLVAQAARTACFTLLADRTDDADDVFVCDQKAEGASQLGAPRWSSYPLTVHPACPSCAGS